MKDLKTFLLLTIMFIACVAKAQDYTIIPTNLDVQGSPGDLMLSTALIQNNTSQNLTIYMKRIAKNIPSGWTSCFCYPTCIAPSIDSLTFTIPPNGTDSIKPNYGTDSIPGFGTIVVTVTVSGHSSTVDTITFTGSTLPAGMSELSTNSFSVFPNPVNDVLCLRSENKGDATLRIYNSSGQRVKEEVIVLRYEQVIDVSQLESGIYFIQLLSREGISTTKKVYKSN